MMRTFEKTGISRLMAGNLRSFNPLFKNLRFYPDKRSSLKSLVNPESCQKIIDKLDLKLKYPNTSNLDILDIFPGFGLLSTMINHELQPRNHVLVEEHPGCTNHYTEMKSLLETTGNTENIRFYPRNGYKWETFNDLVNKDKIIQVKDAPRDKIHDELLVVANVLSYHLSEPLFAQWLMCCAHKNWLQKYGRVRMICLIPEVTAQKFLSGPGFPKRNRTAVKRDIFTETKLIAINEIDGDNYMPDGYNFDPNLLVKDQPVVLSLDTVHPAPIRMAVVEVEPKDPVDIDVESLDYVTQILMYRSTHPLEEALRYIGPGGKEDLAPKLKHLLKVCPRDMKAEDFVDIVKVFDSWAFKPTLEERLSLNPIPLDML